MIQRFKSTCSYCGTGCGVTGTLDRHGRMIIAGDEEHPVNRGMLCGKGMNLHHVAMNRAQRLLHPRMRWSRGHPLAEVSWDAAMNRAAAVFRSLIRRHGPRSVGLYVSGQMLTEEYYVANKLMKGFIGGNNIDTNSRLCMSSAAVGYKLTLGDDLVPAAYEDIEQCECFFISGANPAWCHPILFRRLEQHKERNPNVRVIVADARRTPSCSIADLHLQVQPGTDVALCNAIARILIEREMVDRDFVQQHAEGFERLRETVMATELHEAAAICRVPAVDIARAAEWIGRSPTFITMWAMGLNQSAQGVSNNLALINLSVLTGKIGKPGCGPFSLTGQPNAMGGREVGGMAHLLAAHHDLANAEHREKVAMHWNSGPIDARPGLTATEMFEALDSGEMKAIWIICTNPSVSLPNLRRMEPALARARFVIVQDISAQSDTLRHADLVLPAAGWLEKQGTMTNSERRVSYLPKVLEPPGSARPDVWILCDFARRMGWTEAFAYRDEAEIFAEHARLTRGTAIDMSGMSHERLKREGTLQWPCPESGHAGTPRLFTDRRFATPSGRARLHGTAWQPPAEPPTGDYPLVLTTGRIRDQWHTMTRTGTVAKLRRHVAGPRLEMHPEDAAARGLADGALIEVASPHGRNVLRLQLNQDLKPGVVFMPMHWGRRAGHDFGRANNLTSARRDPISKEPDFKYTAVQARRLELPRRRIAVVGAGAAALQFIRSYREHNVVDEIHVYGREPLMFYNRVLLIEYIGGRRQWDDLLTCDENLLRELNVQFHAGVTVTRIDRESRHIEDETGRSYPYDVLVLGTGSRSFVIPGAPTQMEGVFTLRSRADAERIRAELRPDSRVAVLGGGLLGLEMVGELLHSKIDVTVIQDLPVLMGRQLDATASEMLCEMLEDGGARIILNDQATRYFGRGRIEGLRTRGGRVVECDMLILAAGIRPNIELAVEAGLRCGRGVAVDDQLRTSDPAIHAIGEIAEHRGMLYGTTPSAQDQARVAAAAIAGDPWAEYQGSVLFNILKAPGIELASLGLTQPPADDPDYEEVVLLDRRRRFYKKCVLRRNVLVGAVLLGDQAEFAEFRRLIEEETELDEERDRLLRGVQAERDVAEGPLVCSCHGVGRGRLLNLIGAGCADLETLCARSRAGTGCGSCRPELKALLSEQLANSLEIIPGMAIEEEAV